MVCFSAVPIQLSILFPGLLSFVLAWVLTFVVIRLAPRVGFVDKPGGRKIHANPKPLGGGAAIFWAVVLPMLGVLAAGWWGDFSRWPAMAPYLGGLRQQTPLALGIIAALAAMHLLGLRDDWRAMGPYSKLVLQLLIIALLVVIFDLRALTALDHWGLGKWPSVVVTVVWIGAITNAFNFLDNMDGLSAGVAAVCCAAFLAAALSIGQWFVAANLALLLGALIGFLCFNFPPARIFMGDSGSLLIGLLLGILTVRTTFLRPDTPLAAGWYALLAPVVVVALPLYDLIVVSLIRISRGKSPFKGDTNHFSHRLVARGMSRRTAVLCLYLVTAATAMAAILLPHVDSPAAAWVIFAQTILILGVVALLEQHPLPKE
jgi:UDP-GlcNAc:undecaprenyl-phosphate GlcNAc-1-phosphate transferase